MPGPRATAISAASRKPMGDSPGNGSISSTSSRRRSDPMIDGPPGAAAGRRDKLHGRRRGHKLRPGQQARLDNELPAKQATVAAIAAAGPAGIFPAPPREVWLEIGFGGGEHIAWQAAHNPDIGLIGCEVFQTGIVTLLAQFDGAAEDNVRIVVDDARLVLDVLPDASLGRAFILFP